MSTRTTAQLSRYDEVVVSVLPSGTPSRYNAWIYTKLALPVQLGEAVPLAGNLAPPPEIGGLPLVGREELGLDRCGYNALLSTLYGGEEAVTELRARLFRELSGGLRHLLELRPRAPSRLRIWWSSELPELEAIPWELVALGQCRPPNLSLVRGRPGESVPPLPLAPEQPLRVAVIDPACAAPAALYKALDSLAPELEIRWLDGAEPREALRDVARAGFEVIHVIADGSAPLGLEGLLEFPEEAEVPISPAELHALLRGSRVTILSLTPPEVPRVGRSGLPTVFHAFTRLGHGMIDEGPTLFAQIGPMPPRALCALWSAFYRRLAAALDVEEAAACAAKCPPRAPVALFLRHRFGRQFSRHSDGTSGFVSSPGRGTEQVTTELSVCRDLLEAARALEAKYASLGLVFPSPDLLPDLLEEEQKRQARLASSLDEALSEEDEEGR